MKQISLILTIVLTAKLTLGQNQKDLVSSVIVDANFVDTFTFNLKWDYPWYIMKNDSGKFNSALGETFTELDTVHLFHTTNAITNHQGEHQVRYCVSEMDNDTIKLSFLPELPGFASWLTIKIYNNEFWCKFKAAYPRYIKGEFLIWKIKKQSLIFNKLKYNSNDTIKGYFEIEFDEISTINNNTPTVRNFYFKGYFKTPLKTNE